MALHTVDPAPEYDPGTPPSGVRRFPMKDLGLRQKSDSNMSYQHHPVVLKREREHCHLLVSPLH